MLRLVSGMCSPTKVRNLTMYTFHDTSGIEAHLHVCEGRREVQWGVPEILRSMNVKRTGVCA